MIETADSTRFAELAEQAIEAFCVAHPTEATMLGNHDYDDRLGDPSRAVTEQRAAELRRLLERLDGLADLDAAAAADREILRNEASRELFCLVELDEPSWDATQHDPGRAIHQLLAQDFAPLADRLGSLAGRLRAVPDYLAAARQRLVDPPAVHLQMAINQLSGTHALIVGQVSRLAGQSHSSALAGAAAAVLAHQDWLAGLLPTARQSSRIGEQAYARKLSLTLDTTWQPTELLAQAYSDLSETETELAELVAAHNGGKHAGRAEIAAEFDRLAEAVPTAEDIVRQCQDALAETSRFVEEHELLTLMRDPVEVCEMPEVERGGPVAYCQRPGPVETASLPTRYAISPAPAGWPAEQVRAFYREFNNHMLHDLTVHEAMPGHVEQLSHAGRYQGATKVRAVFENDTFIEGWAVYAEALMAEHGYRSEVSAAAAAAVRMQQLKGRLRMIIFTILDISYHAGDLDEASALRLLVDRGYYEPAVAPSRWLRVQLSACWPPQYYVGYLEVRRLVDDLRASRPRWTDRQLHDTVLSFGSPPARQLRTLLGLSSG